MKMNTVRNIDFNELDELATVGGNDTSPVSNVDLDSFMATVATLTVVTMISGMISTVREIC